MLLQEPAVPFKFLTARAFLVAGTSLPHHRVLLSLTTNLTPTHLNHAVRHPQPNSSLLPPPPCILLPAPPHGGAAPRQRACPEPRWRRRLLLLPALWWRARSSLCCLRGAGPEGGVRVRAGMLWPSPCRSLLSVLLQPDFPLSSEGGEVCSYG